MNPLRDKQEKLLDNLNLSDLKRKVNEIVEFCNKVNERLEFLERYNLTDKTVEEFEKRGYTINRGKTEKLTNEAVEKCDFHKHLDEATKKLYRKCITLDEVWDMMFSSFPSDMENFDTITEDQAYRLLKTLWKKLEKKTYEN
jgi:hypothetical protein